MPRDINVSYKIAGTSSLRLKVSITTSVGVNVKENNSVIPHFAGSC